MIPYGKQTIDEDDIAAVVAVLKSDFLTCGPEVEAFEREFAAFVGAKHAVAVSNATAALHLAMLVADVGAGDRVVTSPNTFLASANCAAFVGATPDFADIDPVTYNLCPVSLEQDWKKDTKAVIAVAYAGQSPDMPEIARVARSHGAIVIEDGCHGVGGGFVHGAKSYKIGGHPWADMTTFSFHPVKTMTTGEGGMLVTDNAEYAAKARLLRGHGMVRDFDLLKGFGANEGPLSEQGPWTYEMQELGYNYRITDIQCALGRSQLRKLSNFIERRREIVARYNEEFANLPLVQTPQLRNSRDVDLISWHLYTIQADFEALGRSRSDIMSQLAAMGVRTQVLYIPVHLQPYYRNTYGFSVRDFSVSESFYQKALSLPLFPNLTQENIVKIIAVVKKFLS